LNVFEQLLHQLVVVVGQRLQHGEPRRLLAVERIAFERNDFRRRMLLVDEGAFEREVDEAGNDVAGKSRYLSQHQLAARGRLQHLEQVMDGGTDFVDLVEEQKARNLLVFELAKNELKLCTFFSSSSHTTTAASTAGSAARMSWTNSTEPGQSTKVYVSPMKLVLATEISTLIL